MCRRGTPAAASEVRIAVLVACDTGRRLPRACPWHLGHARCVLVEQQPDPNDFRTCRGQPAISPRSGTARVRRFGDSGRRLRRRGTARRRPTCDKYTANCLAASTRQKRWRDRRYGVNHSAISDVSPDDGRTAAPILRFNPAGWSVASSRRWTEARARRRTSDIREDMRGMAAPGSLLRPDQTPPPLSLTARPTSVCRRRFSSS